MRPNRSAFSLVELSIVLAIIGLLVGGVLTGQSLLRGASTRGVIEELTQYANAFAQFEQEFNALPGDMVNATDYWGVAFGSTGNDSTCYSSNKTTDATCNGNGDRIISTANPATAVSDGTETYLAWQHLASAGYINGRFTGRGANAGNNGTMAGISTPTSRRKATTYLPTTFNSCMNSVNATYFAGCYYGTGIWTGADAPTSWAPGATFTGPEMSEIDRKIDDGMPGFGQLRAVKSSTCNSDASNYVLNSDAPTCRGIYYVNPVSPYNL